MADKNCTCKKIVITTIGEPTVEQRPKQLTIKSRIKSFIIQLLCKTRFGITNAFAEFCTYGNIHGVRHFYNEAWYEKLIFFVCFCTSIVACALIVQLIRFEWLDKPVILSYDFRPMSIKEIPFPAITICPQARASHKRFDCAKDSHKFAGNLIIDQDLNEKYTTILRSFCARSTHTRGSIGGRGWVSAIDVPLKRPFTDHLSEIALTSDEFIDECINTLSGTENECTWARIMNMDGACYSFNMIDSQELFQDNVTFQYESHGKPSSGWDTRKGIFASKDKTKFYPYRSESASSTNSVRIRLKYDPKDSTNECLFESHRGYNVYIHTPFDYPWNIHNVYKVSTNMKVHFNIIPKVSITGDNLRVTNATKRKCYFSNEVELDYFKNYTQYNCELECYSKESRDGCHCTEFWIPANNSNHVVCGNGSIPNAYCWLQSAKQRLVDDQIRLSLNYRSVCNCWPLCDNTEYEVDQIALLNNISSWYPNTQGYEYTELSFQFKNFLFQPIKREELYTDLDFVSNIGSLLSLFIGTSFLSIIEVAFFFTIRFIKNFRINTTQVNIEFVETQSDEEGEKPPRASPGPHTAWN